MKKGARYSTNKAYLSPIRQRPNLNVATRVHIMKLIFDQGGKKVIGINFEKDGRVYQVEARKEVILSSNSVGTPKFLMVNKA